MIGKNLKISFYLSIIATILASIASGVGLFNAEIYHDNAFVKSARYANDLVTLAVAKVFGFQQTFYLPTII